MFVTIGLEAPSAIDLSYAILRPFRNVFAIEQGVKLEKGRKRKYCEIFIGLLLFILANYLQSQ